MPETFQAGSIHSALKVEIESLEKGLATAEKHLDAFGDSTAKTAQNVDASGVGISKTFDQLAARSTGFAKEFQVQWTKNQNVVAAASRTIGAATSEMGVKFDLVNRQNARFAQEFQQRWKQNQAAAAGAASEVVKGADSFNVLDRNSLRTTERFSRLTNRLISVQFALQSLQGEASEGGKALEIATRGLGIFATTAMLIPGPVGIAAGAVLGLGVAFKAATAAGKETVEVLENARTAVEAIESGRRERAMESEVEGRIKKLFPDSKDVQATKAVADQVALIRRLVTEQLVIEKQVTALHERRKKINETLEDETLGFKDEGFLGVLKQVVPGFMEARMFKLTGELAQVDEQLLNLQRNAPKAAAELKKATDQLANVRFGEKLTAIDKSMTDFRDQTTLLKEGSRFAAEYLAIRKELLQVEKDLNTTALNGPEGKQLAVLGDAAKASAREAFAQRLDFMTEQAKKPIFAELDERRRSMELELEPMTRLQEIEAERARTIERIVELMRARAFAMKETFEEEKARAAADKETKEKFEQMKLLANQQDFQDVFAGPASAGVFRGLAEGIMDAQKPMEILAGIGENLFGNMVNSFASQMQKQLTTALTSAFGAGGTALGNLFTGVLGIVGLFMSRGKSSSSQSFDNVSSRVESTQAVRGLVAGPTSIPIAAVAPDLRRALGPSERWLELIAANTGKLVRMASAAGGGSSLAGGFQFAGTVPLSS